MAEKVDKREDLNEDEIPEPTADGFSDPIIKEAIKIASDWTQNNQDRIIQRDFLDLVVCLIF